MPLQVSGAQRPARPIVYDGATFMPGEPLTVLYQLNTYRITYDVPVLRSRLPEDWEARFGGTLALRDAQVRLTQGTTRRNFANYGPVPLVFGAVHAALGRDWALESDLEAFPAPGGGGLLDTALRLTWRPTSRIAAYAGVRYETGGATDDRFFNFLHTRTAIVGVRAAFLR